MTVGSAVDTDAIDDVLGSVLQPGQDIVIGQGAGTPLLLLSALGRHRDRLRDSRILIGMLSVDMPDLPGTRIRTFFPAGPLGTADELARREIMYDRMTLYELARGLYDGDIAVDVVLAQGTPANNGWHSLGASVDYLAAAAHRASTVVLETGPAVPWTGTRSTVSADRVLTILGSDGPACDERTSSRRHHEMASHIHALVPDGATVQLGMGPWVAAVVESLTQRRRLRIHTGLLGGWVQVLDEAGALGTDAKVVATGASGTAAFYRYLDHATHIELAGAHETHDPGRLAELPKLHAVNSALEVDLFGQANTEIGFGGRRGGIGGLPDFANAASKADDGLSIIAMSATAGAVSRIVPRLQPEAVSLSSGTVDVLVTEYGAADLRGLSEEVRAQRIIQVSAPDHRQWLRDGFDHLDS